MEILDNLLQKDFLKTEKQVDYINKLQHIPNINNNMDQVMIDLDESSDDEWAKSLDYTNQHEKKATLLNPNIVDFKSKSNTKYQFFIVL